MELYIKINIHIKLSLPVYDCLTKIQRLPTQMSFLVIFINKFPFYLPVNGCCFSSKAGVSAEDNRSVLSLTGVNLNIEVKLKEINTSRILHHHQHYRGK